MSSMKYLRLFKGLSLGFHMAKTMIIEVTQILDWNGVTLGP